MIKEIICTVCPMGCHITVQGENEKITSVSGYSCKRGETYAETEFAHPVRILTTTVRTQSENIPLIPVRSAKPVPKEKMFDCMEILRKTRVQLPVKLHDVIVHDICGTGSDIVATAEVENG